MKLGGFVIHGAAVPTLGACVESLRAVCDEVVAVDGRVPGSPPIAELGGVQRLVHPWEGYGAARAAAVRALAGCDYVFFLDSDEWLGPDAVRALRAWKASSPRAPYYALERRDRARLGEREFVYRTEHHVRLIRADAARWDASMIVHEALPPAPTERLDVTIDHLFATSVDAMRRKCDRYALLWAVRFRDSPRRVKWSPLQRAFHLARELVARGALFRGGSAAVPLAAAIARHHARKYELLAEVRAGAHADAARAFAEGRYGELFALLSPDGGSPDVAARPPPRRSRVEPAAGVRAQGRSSGASRVDGVPT